MITQMPNASKNYFSIIRPFIRSVKTDESKAFLHL